MPQEAFRRRGLGGLVALFAIAGVLCILSGLSLLRPKENQGRPRFSLNGLLLLTAVVVIICFYRDLPRQNSTRLPRGL